MSLLNGMCDGSRHRGSILAFLFSLVALACALFYNGNEHYLYEIAGGATLLAFSISLYHHSRTRVSIGYTGLALLAFFLWSALAVIWSQTPYVSMVDLGALGSALAFYLIARAQAETHYTLHINRFLICLAIVFALDMIVQTLLGQAPEVMFLNKNSAAGMINLIWPVIAAAWLFAPDRSRRHLGAAGLVALMFFAVGLTGSRGAAIAALVGLALIAAFGWLLARQRRATMTLVVAALVALILSNLLSSEAIVGGFRTMADPGSAGATRFVIWSQAWAMIQQHPWLGFGPGVFYLVYPAFRLPADHSAGYFVHNDYLEFWLERGLPGLLLMLAIIGACVWLFWRHCRAAQRDGGNTALSPSAVGAFTALATIATHSLFSYSLQMMPFLLVVGFRIAELERAVSDGPGVRIPIPNLRRPLPTVSVAVVTLLGLWAFTVHALYFDRVDRGIRHAQYGEYAQAAESFRKARAIWSLPDSAWYLQANTHYMALRRRDGLSDATRTQLVDGAIELLEGARERNAAQPSIPLLLGLYRANFPEQTSGSAQQAFRRALAIDPRTLEARYSLSQLLERKGHRQQALAVVKEGLKMPYKRGRDISPLTQRIQKLEQEVASPARKKEFAAPSLE